MSRACGSSSSVRVTGVLLVGGASARFGSPKALARLDGTTLGERAWRLLDFCDERLAVGKDADALPLPFEIIDDGAVERAAIHGVRAGLAAARHDVCLFLPVDVPLVTRAALRALAEAVAVPASGPLPGAYRRSILPEVERRIRLGQLAVRGLAERVLELDEALFANANTRADLARIAASVA